MVSRLTLSSDNLKYLVSLSKDSLPMESCALLLGETRVGNLIEAIVTDVIYVRNEAQSSASFSIEPEELLNIYRLAEAKKLQVIGIFHSHPSDPVPSPTDQRYMKINPVAWLIYSTTKEEFGAFIFEDSIRKVELLVMA